MSNAERDLNFYSSLPPFHDFAEVVDPSHYRALPDDWLVVVTDIENSTAHCRDGREKAVNMVGAASIMAVLNVAGAVSVPFVFGGDGASLAIPLPLRNDVENQLRGLRGLARSEYGFSLRVAVVPVSDLREAGGDVRVARFALSPGNHLATFTGGGIELAETWVKQRSCHLLDDAVDVPPVNLAGLSCRWEPIRASNGVALSMLVRAHGREAGTAYTGVFEDIAAIMGGRIDHAHPLQPSRMQLRWPSTGLEVEAVLTRGTQPAWRRRAAVYTNALLQKFMDRFHLRAGAFDARTYREEASLNADFRRFDDTLRILFDCSDSQAARVERMLERRAAAGQLRYGLHRADRAYMTCLVFDLGRGQHLHFVDGADGGFTAAARNMKAANARSGPADQIPTANAAG
ncbi:MAG: DUF3095 domain-containing protein [Proteobacteria bacterium]|nr:MAG: DUF3095 domain-containing protein [Pseudomonadota bacterium]